ncbi:SAF domain-containing protein [Jatrophihabitans sp. YIM 134969]
MVAPPAVSPSDPAGPPSPLAGPLSASLPASPSPRRTRRPRWLDLRLVLGVVLVLGSVLLGAVVVSRAQASTAVWSLRRDLPAGSVLTAGDLTPVDVRLGDTAGRYVAADRAVVGRRLAADVGSGQLLPTAAVGGAGDDGRVTVSIPFASADVPSVARGDVITVWVSTPTCASVVLLRGVAVQDVGGPGSGLTASDGLEVVVTVSPELADRIVGALALDDVTLRAGVLSGAAPASGSADLPDLAACAPVGPGAATPTPTAS